MKTLKIFCQYGHKYCKCGNFGDKLTAFILQKLTPYEVKSVTARSIKSADIIGIGSILQRIPEDYEGIIWSSGFLFEDNLKKFSKAKLIAVRGKLTLSKIDGCKENTILGDGGLLCYLFADTSISKKYKLGIIPHYIDKENTMVQKLTFASDEIKFIDVCDPCEKIIRELQECEYIISSSLHGVIAADSLNIPNEWVKLSNRVKGDGFKFRDYYSVFDMADKLPMLLSDNDNLDSILSKLQKQKYERKNISVIKSQLFETIKGL